MDGRKMKIVYSIVEREKGRSFWTRLGVAFQNKDGSITLKLDAIPITGTLQLRDPEPRDHDLREGAGNADPAPGAGIHA